MHAFGGSPKPIGSFRKSSSRPKFTVYGKGRHCFQTLSVFQCGVSVGSWSQLLMAREPILHIPPQCHIQGLQNAHLLLVMVGVFTPRKLANHFPPGELVVCNLWHKVSVKDVGQSLQLIHSKGPCHRWALPGFVAGGILGRICRDSIWELGRQPGCFWEKLSCNTAATKTRRPHGDPWENSKATPVSSRARREKLLPFIFSPGHASC